MSQSRHQPTTVAFGIVAVMLVLVTLYAAVYLWRWRQVRFVMDVSRGWGSSFSVRPRFPTSWENRLFWPALWIHERLHPAAFNYEGPLEMSTDPPF
jgi:hypothetical protein